MVRLGDKRVPEFAEPNFSDRKNVGAPLVHGFREIYDKPRGEGVICPLPYEGLIIINEDIISLKIS